MKSNESHSEVLEELLTLASQQCSNTITAESLERLEQILVESPALRSRYLDYVRLNADLMWLYRTGEDTPVTAVSESVDIRQSVPLSSPKRGGNSSEDGDRLGGFRYRRLIIGFAAAVLFVGAMVTAWVGRDERSVGDNQQVVERLSDSQQVPDPAFIATLLDASTVVWMESGEAIDPGARIAPGEIWLESGEAELLFDTGAKLLLSGPARMNLQSPLAAHLESGAIVAHMPASAVGFKLSTAAADFIDQGTEFGVVAAHGGPSEVHVFRGQVDVQTRNSRTPVELFSKEAMRIESAEGTGKSIEFSRAPFGGLDLRVASPIQWPVQDGGNDHYYQLVVLKKPITWHEAAIDAMGRHYHGMPGHLVTVTSRDEDRFLVQSIIDETSTRGVWIGLTDVLRESDFRWITGEPMGYMNWATYPDQQPDNYQEADWHGGEDYGMYTTFVDQQPWAWNDLSVDSMHEKVSAFIVEYEPPIAALKHRSMALEPVCWEVSDGGNGHHYQLVLSLESVDWETIRRRARDSTLEDSMGHLACLETEAEKDFVVQKILRVSGIPENMIGLSGGPSSDLTWVTGKPMEGIEFGKPFLPAGKVYGLLFWDHQARRWGVQTRGMEALPAAWFGYVVEYPSTAFITNPPVSGRWNPMGPVPQDEFDYIPWMTEVAGFRYPSDPGVGAPAQGRTNYGPCMGDSCHASLAHGWSSWTLAPISSANAPFVRSADRGVFAFRRASNFRDILDGLSNTIAMGEITSELGDQLPRDSWNDVGDLPSISPASHDHPASKPRVVWPKFGRCPGRLWSEQSTPRWMSCLDD